MVVVSYSGREINAKIVYYGPGLSGKTTNLEKIYDSVPETNRGRMVSMKTQTDRTLFFDLLPLDLGELQGMKTRLLLYTVPGQVYYNATRKLVLKGVDAVVFVADSATDKMAENRESFANLEMNLKAYGIDIKTIPLVMQFNKRDLTTAISVEEMNHELNRYNVPWFEAQAASGIGVFETLRGVSKLLLAKISKDVLDKDKSAAPASSREGAREIPTGPKPEVAAAKKSDRAGTGGKLLKYLKRGKGGRDEAAEPTTPGRVRPAEVAYTAALEPAPLLSDEALIDDAQPPSVAGPRALNAEEELVLNEDDLIDRSVAARLDPEPEPGHARADSSGDFSGEFELESGVPGSKSVAHSVRHSKDAPESGDVRRISVPIDLGTLPHSGTITLTLELKIRVESDDPQTPRGERRRSSGLDESFTRNIEVVS